MSGQSHRQFHVLPGGERRHEIEGLEDETDLLPAHPGQRVFIQAGQGRPGDHHLTRVHAVEARRALQQRRLARSGAPMMAVKVPSGKSAVTSVSAVTRLSRDP
jgi:hypothetical protein